MSQSFRCGDPEALVGYLYEEDSPDERRAAEAHLAACASCAREVAGLGGARSRLATWQPPIESLDFQVTRRPTGAAPVVVPWWRQPMPAWMQAAAAVLVFGAGMAVGGRQPAPASPVPAATTAEASAPAAVPASASDLAGLETRLRSEIAQLKASQAQPAAVVHRVDQDQDQAMLRRVQTLIGESEERQRRELALRTAEVVRDLDAQRRADLTRVQQTMGQIEGSTGAELRQQRELWNFLMNNVSQRGTVR